MSSQIIPLKARADSQIGAELRPGGPLAFELQRRDTQLGAGFCRDLQQAFYTDVGHPRPKPFSRQTTSPPCGVAEKARIGRDLSFRAKGKPSLTGGPPIGERTVS